MSNFCIGNRNLQTMIIDHTGKVGIGTDAPTQELHVVGQILSSVTSGNNDGLRVTTGNNGISSITLSNSTGNVKLSH